ncbi:MAG: TlpA disulfide reductase family protein [Patescibacteria group bacterium]
MKFASIKIVVIALGGAALLFLVVMLGGTYFLPQLTEGITTTNGEVEKSERVGARAPYFDLPNLSGDHVTLAALADRPLVILFWATWSEQSTDALHILDEYIAEHQKDAALVSFITINSQEEKSLVSSFMRRGGYQTPVVLDALGKVSGEYEVKSLPTFYFVDRTGVVRAEYAGVLSKSMLGDKVEQALR